jgi:hypothetical protein
MRYVLGFTTTSESDAARLSAYLDLKRPAGVSRRGLVVSAEVGGESDERRMRQLVGSLGIEVTTEWRLP